MLYYYKTEQNAHLCFGERNILMVVAFNQKVPGFPQDVFQLAGLIYEMTQEPKHKKIVSMQKKAFLPISAAENCLPFLTARTDDDSFSCFFSDPASSKHFKC